MHKSKIMAATSPLFCNPLPVTIKTIKTENITHKHTMTLIVLSQSNAVNKYASME